MSRQHSIHYDELHDLLLSLGFIFRRTKDGNRAYRHAASDTLILLGPHANQLVVRQADLLAVRKYVIEKGIETSQRMTQRLRQIVASRLRDDQPVRPPKRRPRGDS